MNNLKIEVNKDQPLEDIVRVLEGKGLKCFTKDKICSMWVIVGGFGWYSISRYNTQLPEVTLAELKEMK